MVSLSHLFHHSFYLSILRRYHLGKISFSLKPFFKLFFSSFSIISTIAAHFSTIYNQTTQQFDFKQDWFESQSTLVEALQNRVRTAHIIGEIGRIVRQIHGMKLPCEDVLNLITKHPSTMQIAYANVAYP